MEKTDFLLAKLLFIYFYKSSDLKPENLVFCYSGNNLTVKLTDFGLSRTFMPGEMIESSCGSLEYSAPEILLGDFYDPPKVGKPTASLKNNISIINCDIIM